MTAGCCRLKHVRPLFGGSAPTHYGTSPGVHCGRRRENWYRCGNLGFPDFGGGGAALALPRKLHTDIGILREDLGEDIGNIHEALSRDLGGFRGRVSRIEGALAGAGLKINPEPAAG